MTALTTADTQAVRIGLPGTWAKTGWIPPDDLTFDEWQSIGDELRIMERCLRLWWGDWLNCGERQFSHGEKYAQALEASDYEKGSLKNAAYVTGRVPSSLRRDALTFSHYQTVAPLKTLDERREWLAKAEAEDWSYRQLEKEIKASNSHTPQTILIQCPMCRQGWIEKVV